MQNDYHRNEILNVLRAGPADDEDFYRIQVRGKNVSKHLNINHDQLRTIADIVDDTNPPTLLHLQNGYRVLRADTWLHHDGGGEGYVLAERGADDGNDFVTWHVYLHKGESRWLASNGDYCSTMEKALVSFNERRGVTVPA